MAVLARNEICKRLFSPDEEKQIFLPGSWDAACVRGAAYDLRVASDFLITPSGTRYWPEGPAQFQKRRASFVLRPGEVAFVSSTERLCMPWDLAGNIAPKFRFALDGILVMGGLLVDPGYGRADAGGGMWRPTKDGNRLHFQLANIGTDELQVKPGETSIAAIQLLRLDGDPRREFDEEGERAVERLRVPSTAELLADLFHVEAKDPLEPLEFFSSTANLSHRLDELRVEVEKNEVRIKESERSTDRLVVFGIFLIAITLFAAAIAAILGLLTAGNRIGEIGFGVVATGALLLGIVGFASWKIMMPAVRAFESK